MNLPKTKYARSGDVRIAYQITGDRPFDVAWAPGAMPHLDLDWEIPVRRIGVRSKYLTFLLASAFIPAASTQRE